MPKQISPKFPLIVTSYEVALHDAKFLAHYRWKYVVVDEVIHKLSSCNGPCQRILLQTFWYDVFIFAFYLLVGTPVEKFKMFVVERTETPADGK